jgi:oxygen tolerance protein BatD
VIALAALLLLQHPQISIATEVDRGRVTVGEELTLTVRVHSRPADPIQLDLGSMQGLSIVASREVTAVDLAEAEGPARVTTREVRLRAEAAGRLSIGPIRVRLGETTASEGPVAIDVVAPAMATRGTTPGTTTTRLGPVALRLLSGAPPPPRADEVALTVVVSRDTVYVGQQLDVVVAAWFPRELQGRINQSELVLTPPRLEGVWTYPQPAPAGVVTSRLVQGRWMDLFAAHQVVFPLTPGRLPLPPAMLQYAVVVQSYVRREERYSLAGDSAWLEVRPLPAAGRLPPPSDAGIAAQDLTLELEVQPRVTRAGEPLDVRATVRGVGNVALWPPPAIPWPAGFRAYEGPVTTDLDPRDGIMGGVKRFEFLVVPDSGGRVVLDGTRYGYFDLRAGAYRVAATPPLSLTVRAAGELRTPRSLPPLLAAGAGSDTGLIRRAIGALPRWGLLVVVVFPPLLVWLTGRRRERVIAARREVSLGALERDFVRALEAQVPGALERDPPRLAAALRAAGVEAPVAEHAVRLRDRLRAERYGPVGMRDEEELEAEVRQMLSALGAVEHRRALSRRRALGGAGGAALLLMVVAPATPAQRGGTGAPGAEALYAAGALRAAGDSFAARAEREPRVAAHWYNLGAAAYRAGADGQATAAWVRAARLDPRNRTIRAALTSLPMDRATRALVTPWWATAEELLLLSAVAWIGGWMLVAAGRRTSRSRRWAAATLGIAIVAGGLGGRELARRDRRVAIVRDSQTALRVAPYGPASAAHAVEAGTAVIVDRESPGSAWLLVRRDGERGWVLRSEVLPL